MEAEFQKLKEEITTAFQKKPFGKKRGMHVWTDASKEGGLGYMVAEEEGEWTEAGELEKKVNKDGGQ